MVGSAPQNLLYIGLSLKESVGNGTELLSPTTRKITYNASHTKSPLLDLFDNTLYCK
uniref:Uncharacterized protein n=1 Tax=Rhizophagus irregularis (strain DAOM 181602 / DAOM 197198 / MUCL 43194) TaxID=747089 RepID=U9TWA8_RHIID